MKRNTINEQPLEFGNSEQIAWLKKQATEKSEPEVEKKPAAPLKAIGQSVNGDDMHWTVNCPTCDKEYEYKGFFDSTEQQKCKCGCIFITERMEFEDGSHIK